MNKKCSRCGSYLPLDIIHFGADKYNSDGFTVQCRDCRKIYYHSNKEQIAKRHSEYRKLHKTKYNEYSASWKSRNLDRSRQKSREYHKLHREQDKITAKIWRKANPDKIKDYNARALRKGSHLRHRYGISLIEFNDILERQDHKCVVCNEVFNTSHIMTRPHVDHDHNTGRVRGILHMQCNTMLGHAKDKPERLEKGAKYLRDYENLKQEKDNPCPIEAWLGNGI